MRPAKLLAVFAIAALAVGAFTAVALAGNKKKTKVIYFTGSPQINKSGKVTVKGSLNTTSICKPGRGMRLQVLDSTGTAIATLDGSTSDLSGNYKLQGQLPNGLAAGSSVRVKATKISAGKFVCKSGVSVPVPVPAPAPAPTA
jgi:hypothetical protein